jgi:hypothetical protein
MPKKLDLTGTETEYFKIISPAPNIKNRTAWNCICKRCGKSCIITTDSLRGSKVKSCGCLKKDLLRERNQKNIVDLTGERFGRLIVIKYAGTLRDHAAWECRCDCGNVIITDSGSLKAGYRTSCGCFRTSLGAQKIENCLIKNHILYKKEYTFSDLKNYNNKPLYFDFAIFDKQNQLIKLIEYDGEQHFSTKGDNIFFSDSLETRKKNDNSKNSYCEKNNLILLRIPYTLKNKITLNLLLSEEEKEKCL